MDLTTQLLELLCALLNCRSIDLYIEEIGLLEPNITTNPLPFLLIFLIFPFSFPFSLSLLLLQPPLLSSTLLLLQPFFYPSLLHFSSSFLLSLSQRLLLLLLTSISLFITLSPFPFFPPTPPLLSFHPFLFSPSLPNFFLLSFSL